MNDPEFRGPSEQDKNPESPTPEKPSLRKRAAQGVGCVVLAVVGLWTISNAKLIKEHLEGATSQEQQISDLTHRAFGEALTIRCVAIVEGDTSEAVASTTRSMLDIIDPVTHIQDSECDAISDFMADPSKPPSQVAIDALLDLGHEYSHVANNDKSTDNEGGAECMGAQRTGLLAAAAGATSEDAAAIQRKIAHDQIGATITGSYPENWPVIPPGCVPGGEFDLGLPNTVLPRVGRIAG